MHKLIKISKMLNRYPDKTAMFNNPVVANLPVGAMQIHGVCKTSTGIGVLDGAGEWHGPLMASQLNAACIVNAVHKRLKKESV